MTGARNPSSNPEDASSITPSERRRRAIGLRLRQLRQAAGLTQVALAERLGVTQSMLSRLENGDKSATPRMLERIADALYLAPDVREDLAARQAELEIEVDTLRVLLRQGGERSIQGTIRNREADATAIWKYQSQVVPGLLQTPDYMRAMVPLIAPDLPDLDDLVAGRLERQSVLYDRRKDFRFLIDEAALRRRVGPAAVLRGQIDRLLTLSAALPHVQLRVLPFSAALDRWAMTSFSVRDDVAEVEWQVGTMSVRDVHHVDHLRELFGRLWAVAAEGEALRALLRDIDSWLAGLAE